MKDVKNNKEDKMENITPRYEPLKAIITPKMIHANPPSQINKFVLNAELLLPLATITPNGARPTKHKIIPIISSSPIDPDDVDFNAFL